MSNNSRNCGFRACESIGLIISIVFGVLVAALFASGLIPFITTAVWILFGLAVLFLVFLVSGVYFAALSVAPALQKCICKNALCLLAGTIGTIISAIVALSIELVFTLIAVIVIIGFLAFFFALMILGLIALIRCIVDKLCCGE